MGPAFTAIEHGWPVLREAYICLGRHMAVNRHNRQRGVSIFTSILVSLLSHRREPGAVACAGGGCSWLGVCVVCRALWQQSL